MDQNDVLEWMWGDARHLALNQFFSGYCEKLVQIGIPLRRVHLSMAELHPEYLASAFSWNLTGVDERHLYRSDHPEESTEFLNSPIKALIDGSPPIRAQLGGSNQKFEYPILNELQEEGFTDYAIHALPFRNGRGATMSFATNRIGGFTDLQMEKVEALLPATGLQLEYLVTDQMVHTVLRTYVGKAASKRIVEGDIERGVAQSMQAVVWYADLRRFTEIAEHVPPETLIQLLNQYFEILVHAVEDGGGEVLKFIGDALLAVFPLSSRSYIADVACEVALAAAEEAFDNIAIANKDRVAQDQPVIEVGIAMHVGEVMYGNIGSENRLDFTVIGPAVNLASRLQALAPALGVPLIVSEDFKSHSRRTFDDLGEHSLKGIEAPHRVFTLSSRST